MLLMKAWLETRGRLLFTVIMLGVTIVANYTSGNPGARNARGLLLILGSLLALGALQLAGSGIKSQAPIGFPEGLAGSTQFTISLPVTRLRLLAVRAGFGLLEIVILTVIVSCTAWSQLPWVRNSGTPADFARLVLVAIFFLLLPYCSAVLFATVIDEPFSMVCAGWTLILVLWALHRTPSALDIICAWGDQSPLITHTLPWPQIATCAGLASILFWTAAFIVRKREY